MRKFRYITAASLLAAAATQASADSDLDIGIIPSQEVFDTVVDQLGVATAWQPVAPAAPLGTAGFDVGLVVTAYDIDSDVWDLALSDGDAPSMLPVPRLVARKGLPLGIDVGVSYAAVPGSNIRLLGGGISKALLDGSMATPAVGLSAHYSRLDGVDDLDLSNYGVDLGISKGFALLTPYAGIGQVWYKGEDERTGGFAARDESELRSYLGVRLGMLPFMSLTAQADFSEVDSYSLRLDLGF